MAKSAAQKQREFGERKQQREVERSAELADRAPGKLLAAPCLKTRQEISSSTATTWTFSGGA